VVGSLQGSGFCTGTQYQPSRVRADNWQTNASFCGRKGNPSCGTQFIDNWIKSHAADSASILNKPLVVSACENINRPNSLCLLALNCQLTWRVGVRMLATPPPPHHQVQYSPINTAQLLSCLSPPLPPPSHPLKREERRGEWLLSLIVLYEIILALK